MNDLLRVSACQDDTLEPWISKRVLRRGQRDEALASLEACVQLGFGNRAWIVRDPDLASLHGDPRYEALIRATA